MAWPEPELDAGDDAGLLRPLLEPLELELLGLELLEVGLELGLEVGLEVGETEPDVPDELALVDAALPVEPGSARATAPAASTLATPTVAVVVVIRPRPRCRAVTARATASCFGLFMTRSLAPSAGRRLSGVSEPPMSNKLRVGTAIRR